MVRLCGTNLCITQAGAFASAESQALFVDKHPDGQLVSLEDGMLQSFEFIQRNLAFYDCSRHRACMSASAKKKRHTKEAAWHKRSIKHQYMMNPARPQ